MMGMERRSVVGEQLLVLWTWLLEGYVPVPHTVADLDELEDLPSSRAASTRDGDLAAVGNAPRRRAA